MKKIVVLFAGLVVALPLQAQLINPESVTGAAMGGILGGVIGHNSGHHGGEGAAIGAGLGFLMGNLAHHSRVQRENQYYSSAYPAYGYPGSGYSGYRTVVRRQPTQQQTVINSTYNNPAPAASSAMSGANALFGR